MPSSTQIPTTPPSELATTLSLAEVMRALGLDHAASILEPAMAKAIAHNDSPRPCSTSSCANNVSDARPPSGESALKGAVLWRGSEDAISSTTPVVQAGAES